MARGRTINQLARLRRDPELLKTYADTINKYIEEGVVALADLNYDGPRTILPHHAVVKPDRTTTKVRVVFDGTAKVKKKGPALNQLLIPGPNLNPDIMAVLLRIREEEIAWTADLEKAFHSILLAEEDSEVVCFYWSGDPTDPQSPLKLYAWKRVPFGLACSPFMLKAVILKHIKQFEDEFPEAVRIIKEQLYVDDLMGTSRKLQQAEKTIKEMLHIFSEAKMKMTKWTSNEPTLQEHFQGKKRFDGMEGALGQNIAGKGKPKVLGVAWDPETDTLEYNPDAIIEAAKELGSHPTKRQFLSVAARIFDPLGHLGPITFKIKVLFQRMWEAPGGWDDS